MFKVNNDDVSIALEHVDPAFGKRLEDVKKKRSEFDEAFTLKSNRKKVGDNNMFTPFYKKHLPNEKHIINNLKRNLDYGITLIEYINQSISGLDKIVIDKDLNIDLSKENALYVAKVLYVLQVFNALFKYTDIEKFLPKDAAEYIKQVKINVNFLLLNVKDSGDKTAQWEKISAHIDKLVGLLKELAKNIKSDTDISNIMAITKKSRNGAKNSEVAQLAWASLVSGCRLIEADEDEPGAITIRLGKDATVTVNKMKLLDLLSNLIQTYMPDLVGEFQKVIDSKDTDLAIKLFIMKMKEYKNAAFKRENENTMRIRGNEFIRNAMRNQSMTRDNSTTTKSSSTKGNIHTIGKK